MLLNSLFKTGVEGDWEYCLNEMGARLGTGISYMLIGPKGSGKSKMARAFGQTIQSNKKSYHILEPLELEKRLKWPTFWDFSESIDLLIIDGLSIDHIAVLRAAIMIGQDRHIDKKDTLICVTVPKGVPFQAVELLWSPRTK